MSFHIMVTAMGAIASSRTELGPHFSEGARLLWNAKENQSLSHGGIARLIGATGGVVPRWLYGDTRPSWNWASKLFVTFGIPLVAWTEPPSRPFTLPAARETTPTPPDGIPAANDTDDDVA